jgi:hypothetical protein
VIDRRCELQKKERDLFLLSQFRKTEIAGCFDPTKKDMGLFGRQSGFFLLRYFQYSLTDSMRLPSVNQGVWITLLLLRLQLRLIDSPLLPAFRRPLSRSWEVWVRFIADVGRFRVNLMIRNYVHLYYIRYFFCSAHT